MPAAKALPQFEAFGPYVDPFGASQTALGLWTEYWRTSVASMIWWTERWLQVATSMIPATLPGDARGPAARPVAAIIDLARAAAARTAADMGDVAAAAVDVAETAAEIPTDAAEEAVAVAEAPAKTRGPDDLTRLVGIGPKLAAALAEQGVTRFAQIAAWTDKDLGRIDKALDLKGRAWRDAWIAQAKRMVSEA